MAALAGCFVDTSILVAGIVDFGEASAPAQRLLTAVAERKIRDPLTAWHCCLEFYSVITRLPAEFRASPAVAVQLLEQEIISRFKVVQLPVAGRGSFVRLLEVQQVRGGRTYDAHIAEVARAARTTVVITENRRHFTSLLRHGIRVLTAVEALEEA